jgi:hypothetical protein
MSFSLCGSVGANTGVIKCDRRRGIPKKIIIGSAVFDSTDYASASAFDAAFIADFKLATGNASKLYPFPEITGASDKTEANKESTLGAFGPKVTLIEGRPAYEFDVIAGSTLEKSLRKFNGQQVPVFIVDNSNAIWGKLDENKDFVGTDCLIFTTPHKFGDGANGQTTKVSISFVSASDFSDSAAFIETALSISDMVGLLDVTLAEYAAHAFNVHKMKGFIPTSSPGVSLNLYDNYADELASAALWTAFTGATFATPLTITSIAKNVSNKGWDITFDSTAYTALSAGAKIKINLATPDVLDAADVTGIEGIAFIATK